MPTIRSGATGTAATRGILAAKRIVAMENKIFLLEPQAAPLTVLLGQLDRQSVPNSEFKIIKDELMPIVTAINSATGYTSGATTIKVDNEEYFEVGSIISFPRTDETCRVTALSATDSTATVTRSWGATAAAALVDNDVVIVHSNAYAENADVGTPASTLATSDTNYTEIFRTPYGVSGTLDAQDLYGGNEMSYQAKKHGIEHLRKINTAFWLGEKAEVTSGNYPQRTTGGVQEWISTNVTSINGPPSALEVEAHLRSVFRYGESQVRAAITSREGLSAVAMLALNFVEMRPGDTSFGITIRRWDSPHGSVNIMVENFFSDAAYLKERWYTLDLSQLGYRYLQKRDTHIRTNVQSPGVDGRIDEYLSEVGVRRGWEKSSGLLKDIQIV